jgi:hypothetical protein
MNSQVVIPKKSKGRPAGAKTTGIGVQLNVRLHEPALSEIDTWIATQPDPKPSRPEAIRRLIEKAIKEEIK